jgi:hypothetical protein
MRGRKQLGQQLLLGAYEKTSILSLWHIICISYVRTMATTYSCPRNRLVTSLLTKACLRAFIESSMTLNFAVKSEKKSRLKEVHSKYARDYYKEKYRV